MGRHAKHRRAERDAKRRPARRVLFYDVVLWHHDDEPELSWAAEGGLTGDRSGVSFESTNELSKLVADAVHEVREISLARNGAVIGLHWLMGDNVENPEAAKRAAREIALAAGVELPARVSSRHLARSVPEAHSRPALRWLNARRLAWSVARRSPRRKARQSYRRRLPTRPKHGVTIAPTRGA